MGGLGVELELEVASLAGGCFGFDFICDLA